MICPRAMEENKSTNSELQTGQPLQHEIWPLLPKLDLKLKLAHKGLILVSTLLTIELLFIGTLAVLLKQMEDEVFKESHARAILARGNTLIRDYYDAGTAMLGYGATKNPMFKDRYEQICNRVPKELRSLQLLYANTPRKNLTAEKLEEATTSGFQFLQKCKDMVEDKNRIIQLFMSMTDLQRQVVQTYKHSVSLLDQLADEQRLIEEQTPQNQEQSRVLVKICLIVGVVINVLVAILLGLSFTRGITGRLEVVIDNTLRLGHRQQLQSPLEGSDEISYLDKTFHEVAKALRESERLRQEFLAMISHDLRSPLGTIEGTLQLITMGQYGQLPDKVISVINRCERNTGRMLQLVNDLLDIEKIEAGKWDLKLQKTPISSIINRSIEMIQFQADDRKITISASKSDKEIVADADRLARVLVNLLSNAIKFSPRSSTITINTVELPGSVEIRVIDQGRGVPADAISKLFDRFQQVDIDDSAIHGGSGLGLAISKAIVEAHGGVIGVESEVGKGSTFWFRLPSEQSQITTT